MFSLQIGDLLLQIGDAAPVIRFPRVAIVSNGMATRQTIGHMSGGRLGAFLLMTRMRSRTRWHGAGLGKALLDFGVQHSR